MRWTDKRENVVPGLVDVALAGDEHRALALDLVSWLAEKIGGVQVVERFEASGPAAWFRALGDSLDRAVGLQKAIVDGLSSESADGAELTTGELVAIENQATRLETLAASVRTAAHDERERRERGYAGARA